MCIFGLIFPAVFRWHLHVLCKQSHCRLAKCCILKGKSDSKLSPRQTWEYLRKQDLPSFVSFRQIMLGLSITKTGGRIGCQYSLFFYYPCPGLGSRQSDREVKECVTFNCWELLSGLDPFCGIGSGSCLRETPPVNTAKTILSHFHPMERFPKQLNLSDFIQKNIWNYSLLPKINYRRISYKSTKYLQLFLMYSLHWDAP